MTEKPNIARDGAPKKLTPPTPAYGMKNQTNSKGEMFTGRRPGGIVADEPFAGNLYPTAEKKLSPVKPTFGSTVHGPTSDGGPWTAGTHVEGADAKMLHSTDPADGKNLHGDYLKSKIGKL
jgi:hypothetical protein